MRDLVRVKDPDTGHEFTTARGRAEKAGLRVLGKPATDAFGKPLPAKHSTNHRKAGTPATEKKEA